MLSVLINCEYRLYVLNQSTPLRNNPFLSHWVEAIQRLDTPTGNTSAKPEAALVGNDINAARVELIKALLHSRNPAQFAQTSPRQLHRDVSQLRHMSQFDARTYVRMLEEEGIYEQTPPPITPAGASNGSGPAGTSEMARPQLNSFQQWKQDVLQRLHTAPASAIPELTRLPVELAYLDFLTTLLQEKTLEACAIDPAPVISDYIQHALRLAEQMGLPPDEDAGATAGEELLDRGREAQTRAVKLLLLFMRNLIRKALVPVGAIYFEIQEICVRYVWIREVREFRAFVEEGEGGGWTFE